VSRPLPRHAPPSHRAGPALVAAGCHGAAGQAAAVS